MDMRKTNKYLEYCKEQFLKKHTRGFFFVAKYKVLTKIGKPI